MLQKIDIDTFLDRIVLSSGIRLKGIRILIRRRTWGRELGMNEKATII